MEWQPIDTAPKDGRWVILYVPETDRPEGLKRDESVEFWLARWCNMEWRWFEQDDDVVTGDEHATHWMPLPEPPKAT